MALFRDRYRIESARLPWWDYRDGWFFVTICTWGRVPWFGEIAGGRMRLSSIGYLARCLLREIHEHYPYATLDAFAVMPDHIHAIIVLRHGRWYDDVETPQCGVSTRVERIGMTARAWQPGCLGVVVGRFKEACTRRIRAMGYPTFRWQSRFHDRIIRDERELNAKREYIRYNPLKYAINHQADA